MRPNMHHCVYWLQINETRWEPLRVLVESEWLQLCSSAYNGANQVGRISYDCLQLQRSNKYNRATFRRIIPAKQVQLCSTAYNRTLPES